MPNDLWEDMNRLNALYEELMWSKIISRKILRENRFERRIAVVRYLRNKYPDNRTAWHITEYQYLDI